MAISSIIVGLLIPVAILLIENNGNSNDLSFKWDKMVIFSQVIKIRVILWGLALITLPLVLEKNKHVFPLIIIAYSIGFIAMFSLLKNAYYWIISKEDENGAYRNIKRYEFLNSLSGDIVNQIIVWDTIWGDHKQKIGLDELDLLKIFFKHCKDAENSKKLRLLNTYLRDYAEDTNFVVTSQNYEIIQKYIFSDLVSTLNDSLSDSFPASEYELVEQFKRLFFEFTTQCYATEKYMVTRYQGDFDKFFINTNDKILNCLFKNPGDERFI